MRKIINSFIISIAKMNQLIYYRFINILYIHDYISSSIILRALLLIYLWLIYIFKKHTFKLYNTNQQTYETIINKIDSYDVISFDIFDTLIFRPVVSPNHIFKLINPKEKKILHKRYNAEEQLKNKLGRIPNIYDIYEYIDRNPNDEIEIEIDLCYCNPLMLKVYNTLINSNKIIIAVSDMYLPKDVINRILKKCGYNYFSNIFVSCDINLSKTNGLIYPFIKEKFGQNKSYIHIGDNLITDIINAEKNDISTIHYCNINLLGLYHNPVLIENLFISIQRALINSIKFSGMNYNEFYTFGYAYIGLYIGSKIYNADIQSNSYKIMDFICEHEIILKLMKTYIKINNVKNVDNLENKYLKLFNYRVDNINHNDINIYLTNNIQESELLNIMLENNSIIDGLYQFMGTHYNAMKKYHLFSYIPKNFINKIIKLYAKLKSNILK